MRIVITGASGFIGREIIPLFAKDGVEMLLVGRDEGRLRALFPSIQVTKYETLADAAKGFDALVHLAVMNNDQSGSIEDFRAANVELLDRILTSARAAYIKTIIYTSTLQVVGDINTSSYVQTKREAEDLLSKVQDIVIVNLRLPAVYGTTFKGKLALLKWIPNFARSNCFQIIASLRPTVHVKHVAVEILKAAKAGEKATLVVSDRQIGNWFYSAIKRIVDISFALFVIIFFWWVLIVAWLAVKLSSRGPGIFAQERIGRRGKLFTCYKLRTMTTDTKQVGTHEVSTDSITSVGNFLRKTKIDELPQIWNILKNEMSLVGPRPCLPVQKALIAARDQRGVLDEKGGITGLAQIQGIDMSEPDRLAKLDAEYLNLRSLPFDFRIILATTSGSGQGDKVK